MLPARVSGLSEMRKVMKALMAKKEEHNWPFVDVVYNIWSDVPPDYDAIVTHPMDLKTALGKLNSDVRSG